MPNPWIDGVKDAHELTYYLDSVTGPWLTALRDAVREFNVLSERHGLGVRYRASTVAPSDAGGADVNIATGDGSITFRYAGSHTTTISGTALHGSTLLISRENGPIEKAFIFLPNQPRINTPRGMRPTGAGVMKVIAVHELIHACGLHNADHSADDVFNGFPSADPGRTAAQDRIQISVRGQYRFMPPIILSGATARVIGQNWR